MAKSKYQKAIEKVIDQIDWARVHLQEMEKVKDETSAADFESRFKDVMDELRHLIEPLNVLLYQEFSINVRHQNREVGFDEMEKISIKDPKKEKFVRQTLQTAKSYTQRAVVLVNQFDGAEIPSNAVRKIPISWRRAPNKLLETNAPTQQNKIELAELSR